MHDDIKLKQELEQLEIIMNTLKTQYSDFFFNFNEGKLVVILILLKL